jgi:hypothetical protein
MLLGVTYMSHGTQKNFETKNRTHSFRDIIVLCTISVTSGFELNYELDVTEIALKHPVSPKL